MAHGTCLAGVLLALATATAGAPQARAETGCIGSVTLGQYQLTATYQLPATLVAEASAVTFNWDTGTLFVVGDGGPAILEVTRTGATVSTMALLNFSDTEGLTYVGGGKFVIVEERLGRGYLFTYVAGGTLNRTGLPSAPVGPNTGGNSGSEGIAFDPLMGKYFSVKEKDPQNVFGVAPNFAAGASTYSDLFPAALLAVADLSDIHALATVSSLQNTADKDNLLILSQASALLLKVSRTGTVLGSRSVATLSGTMEGVTMDDRGVIYMCEDSPTPRLFVLSPGAVDACPCVGDVNHDGTVDGADLGIMLGNWGAAPPGAPADLNSDGAIDGADLGALLGHWGPCSNGG